MPIYVVYTVIAYETDDLGNFNKDPIDIGL